MRGVLSLYFIQAGDCGQVKIGQTRGDVKKRLAALQTSNPERLTVRATLHADKDLEREIHEALKAHRLAGEWFQPAERVVEAMRVAAGGSLSALRLCIARRK